MTEQTNKNAAETAAGVKLPYSKPVLQRMDVSETATGIPVFTQEILVYYTPPS